MVYEIAAFQPCAISSSARRSGWSAPTDGATRILRGDPQGEGKSIWFELYESSEGPRAG
jgi:hypothetical protein